MILARSMPEPVTVPNRGALEAPVPGVGWID